MKDDEDFDLDQMVNDYNAATGDSDAMPSASDEHGERRLAMKTSAPNRLAEAFIDYNYGDEGKSLLRRYAGEFHEYAGGWQPKDRERLRAEIRGFADRIDIEVVDKDGEPTGTYKPVRVTTNLVNEIENALVRDVSLPFPTIVTGDRPQWLDGCQSPPARRVIAFRNGLLDVDVWEQSKAAADADADAVERRITNSLLSLGFPAVHGDATPNGYILPDRYAKQHPDVMNARGNLDFLRGGLVPQNFNATGIAAEVEHEIRDIVGRL